MARLQHVHGVVEPPRHVRPRRRPLSPVELNPAPASHTSSDCSKSGRSKTTRCPPTSSNSATNSAKTSPTSLSRHHQRPRRNSATGFNSPHSWQVFSDRRPFRVSFAKTCDGERRSAHQKTLVPARARVFSEQHHRISPRPGGGRSDGARACHACRSQHTPRPVSACRSSGPRSVPRPTATVKALGEALVAGKSEPPSEAEQLQRELET